MKKTISILAATAAVALSAGTAQATLFAYEFNTSGNLEGWVGGVNGHIVSLTQATAVGAGGEGVITAGDLTGNDGQLYHDATITLPTGHTWDNIQIRFRQLAGNPPGGAPASYANTGTLVLFNNDIPGTNSGAFANKSYGAPGGTGFTMTVAADGAGEWQLVTVDFTNATAFNNADITRIRLDVVGNDDTKNFEVDYVRLSSIPEPGSVMLSGLAAAALLLRRRRK